MSGQDQLLLEAPILRLPTELLRNSLKAQQKHIERDVHWLRGATKQLSEPTDSADPDLFNNIIGRLDGLGSKVDACEEDDRNQLGIAATRLRHMVVLEAGGSTGGDLLEQDVLPHTHTTLVSSRQRLDRLIGDHLLRNGLQQTASEYAKLTEVESLVDKQVFGQSSRICEALRRAQIGEALAWCAENKNSLRKRKSRLEFELRKQEFIELCRRERPADAITFAQRNLSAFVEQYPTAVRQATALLCYRQGTVAEPYRSMYASQRWHELADLFRQDHHAIYSIPDTSPLEVAMSAGLAALKSPACHDDDGAVRETPDQSRMPRACPICSPELNSLSKDIPAAHSARSQLVDSITGNLMEGENEPVVLPNGNMYGLLSLRDRSRKDAASTELVVDPRTGESFGRTALRKAFVL